MSGSATRFRPYAKRMSHEARRQQILAAALPIFVEHGFRGTTVEKVAEKVAITKPVTY